MLMLLRTQQHLAFYQAPEGKPLQFSIRRSVTNPSGEPQADWLRQPPSENSSAATLAGRLWSQLECRSASWDQENQTAQTLCRGYYESPAERWLAEHCHTWCGQPRYD